MVYQTVKINANGDAAAMLDELPALLKKSGVFVPVDYSRREAVEIAIVELYERLKEEARKNV